MIQQDLLDASEYLVAKCISQKYVKAQNAAVDKTMCSAYCSLNGFSYSLYNTTTGCGCINQLDNQCSGTLNLPAPSAIIATDIGYLGCFLPGPNMVYQGAVTNVDACKLLCGTSGLRYAALQNGGESCFCTNSYGSAGTKCSSGIDCSAKSLDSFQYCATTCKAGAINSYEHCGGADALSVYEAYSPNGFYATNFLGSDQGGPVGKFLTLVGDAKLSLDFFAVLSRCRNPSAPVWSGGGMWSNQMMKTDQVDIYFEFLVEPCVASRPTGYISFVVQAEGPRAIPYSTTGILVGGYPTSSNIGIPNAFVVSLDLNFNSTDHLIRAYSTDYMSNLVYTRAAAFPTALVPLYEINMVHISLMGGVATVYINESMVASLPVSIPITVGYFGIGAAQGVNGDTQIALLSFGVNNCGLPANEIPGTGADGFSVNCSQATDVTWSNSFNKNMGSMLQAGHSVILDVQMAYDDEAVLACYNAAYTYGSSATISCSDISAPATIYFQAGVNNSAGPVTVELASLTNATESTWNIRGLWDYWYLPKIVQQNVTVTVIAKHTDLTSQIFLPGSYVEYSSVTTSGVTTAFFSSTNSIQATTYASFSSSSPLETIFISLDYSFTYLIHLTATFALDLSSNNYCELDSTHAEIAIYFGSSLLNIDFPMAYFSCVEVGQSAYGAGAYTEETYCFAGFLCEENFVSFEIWGSTDSTKDIFSIAEASFLLVAPLTVFGQVAGITQWIYPFSSTSPISSNATVTVTTIGFALLTYSLISISSLELNFVGNCSVPLSGTSTVTTNSVGWSSPTMSFSGMTVKYWHCVENYPQTAVQNNISNVFEISKTLVAPDMTVFDFITIANVDILFYNELLYSNNAYSIDYNNWGSFFNYSVLAWGGRLYTYLTVARDTKSPNIAPLASVTSSGSNPQNAIDGSLATYASFSANDLNPWYALDFGDAQSITDFSVLLSQGAVNMSWFLGDIMVSNILLAQLIPGVGMSYEFATPMYASRVNITGYISAGIRDINIKTVVQTARLAVTYESPITKAINSVNTSVLYMDGWVDYSSNCEKSGIFSTISIILYGQLLTFRYIPFVTMCTADGYDDLQVDFDVPDLDLVLPGSLTILSTHISFHSNILSSIAVYSELSDFLHWNAAITIETPACTVDIQLDSTGAFIDSIASIVSTGYLDVSVNVVLNESGFIPSFSDSGINLQFEGLSYTMAVGFFAYGWNFHVYQDGTLALATPASITVSDYTVFYHPGNEDTTPPIVDQFEWTYPRIFNSNKTTEIVRWDHEQPGFPSTSHSFQYSADSDGAVLPVYVAVGEVTTIPAKTIAGFTVTSYFIQMMGYQQPTGIFWEARMIATTTDEHTVIIEMNSTGIVPLPPSKRAIINNLEPATTAEGPIEFSQPVSSVLPQKPESQLTRVQIVCEVDELVDTGLLAPKMQILSQDEFSSMEEEELMEHGPPVPPAPKKRSMAPWKRDIQDLVYTNVVFVNDSAVLLIMNATGTNTTTSSDSASDSDGDFNYDFETVVINANGILYLYLFGYPIELKVNATYTEGAGFGDDQQWEISTTFQGDFNVSGFSIPNVQIQMDFIGTGDWSFNPILDVIGFDWTGVISATTGQLPQLGNLEATVSVAFDTHEVFNVTFEIEDQQLGLGELSATFAYHAYATNTSDYALSNPLLFPDLISEDPSIEDLDFSDVLSCATPGVYREIRGIGTFDPSSVGDGNQPEFEVVATYDICSGAWSLKGLATDFNVAEVHIPEVELVMSHSSATDFSVYFSGDVQYGGLNGSVIISAESSGQYYVIISVNDTVDALTFGATFAYYYQETGFIAVGDGFVTFSALDDEGFDLSLQVDVTYANKPSSGSNMWSIQGTFNSAFTLFGQSMESVNVSLWKPSANSVWFVDLSAQVTLPSFGITAAASIALEGSTIQHFTAAFDYAEGDHLHLGGTITIPGKAECAAGNLAMGQGSAKVHDMGVFADFEVDVSFQVACDNSSYFFATLHVAESTFSSFTIGGEREFGFSNADAAVTLTRNRLPPSAPPSTSNPVHFSLVAKFYGVDNLQLSTNFEISPLGNFEAEVDFSLDSEVTRRNSHRTRDTSTKIVAKSPGDIIAVLGSNSPSLVTSSTQFDFTTKIPTVTGPSATVYYDMFSRATISEAKIVFKENPITISATLTVSMYSTSVQFYISLEKITTWGIIACVEIDFDHLGSNTVLKTLKDEAATAMFVATSRGGTYTINGKQITAFPNSITIYAELKEDSSNMATFKQNSGNDLAGEALIAYAEMSASQVLLLVELSGIPEPIGNSITMTKLWLSLQISEVEFDFGFVAEASIVLGKNVTDNNEITAVVLLQMYLIASDEGGGLGIFMAVCMNSPYEIIKDIYLQFPIKFKFEMLIFPELTPVAFGLAGGFHIGDGSMPALSAYAQVYVNAEDPTQSSFYLSMGKFDLYALLKTFLQDEVPSFLSGFITFESLNITFNLAQGTVSASSPNRGASNPSDAVASQNNCSNTLALLQLDPIPSGVYINLQNLNIGNGFLVIKTAQIQINPKKFVYMDFGMEPFTRLPGVKITDSNGQSGPRFILDFEPTLSPPKYDVLFSAGIDLFGIYKEAINFTLDDSMASAFISRQIEDSNTHAVVGSVDFSFSFDYRNPLDGLSVIFDAKNLETAIIDLVIDTVNSVFNGFNDTLQDAKDKVQAASIALNQAKTKLESAQQQIDNKLSALENDVARKQGKVSAKQSSCKHDDKNCKWYKPWVCVEAGVCWVEYGLEWAGLEAAQASLHAIQSTVDIGFGALETAVSGLQLVLDGANAFLGGLQQVATKIEPYVDAFIAAPLDVINIRELRASFIMSADQKPNVDFLFDFSFMGSDGAVHISCTLGWPDIGNCIKPLILNIMNNLMSIKNILKRDDPPPMAPPGYILNLAGGNTQGTLSVPPVTDLKWLDISNNDYSSGLSAALATNTKIQLLYLQGNPRIGVQDNILNSVKGLLNLQSIVVDPLQLKNTPVDFAALTGLRFLLRLQLDNSTDFCSECAPIIRFSGMCFQYNCSNANIQANLISIIASHISTELGTSFSSDLVSIVQTLNQDDQSSLTLFQVTGASTSYQAIHQALGAIQSQYSWIQVQDIFPVCPNLRMGLACRYVCRFGQQPIAAPDGLGGYIQPIFLGVYDADVFTHARPMCYLPTSLSHECSATLMRTQAICQEFIETYEEAAVAACQLAITRAKFFCSAEDPFMIESVLQDFEFVIDSIYNHPVVENSATQLTIEVSFKVPQTIDTKTKYLMNSILTSATSGRVAQFCVDCSNITYPGFYVFTYEIVVNQTDSVAAFESLNGIASENLMRNIYGANVDAIPGSLVIAENVAYQRYAVLNSASGIDFWAGSALVSGIANQSATLGGSGTWSMEFGYQRNVSRLAIYFDPNHLTSSTDIQIQFYVGAGYKTSATAIQSNPLVLFIPHLPLAALVLTSNSGTVLSNVEIYSNVNPCSDPASGGCISPAVCSPSSLLCVCPTADSRYQHGTGCITAPPSITQVFAPPAAGGQVYFVGTGLQASALVNVGGQIYSIGGCDSSTSCWFNVPPGIYGPTLVIRIWRFLDYLVSAPAKLFNYQSPYFTHVVAPNLRYGTFLEICGGNLGTNLSAFAPYSLTTNVVDLEGTTNTNCLNPHISVPDQCLRCIPVVGSPFGDTTETRPFPDAYGNHILLDLPAIAGRDEQQAEIFPFISFNVELIWKYQAVMNAGWTHGWYGLPPGQNGNNNSAWVDVWHPLLSQGGYNFAITDMCGYDPAPGKVKMFIGLYWSRNRRWELAIAEDGDRYFAGDVADIVIEDFGAYQYVFFAFVRNVHGGIYDVTTAVNTLLYANPQPYTMTVSGSLVTNPPFPPSQTDQLIIFFNDGTADVINTGQTITMDYRRLP